MAKFDKMVAKFELLTDPEALKKSIEAMESVRHALQQTILHYSDQEKLNNWQEVWYSNAKDSYEEKINKVDGLIICLRGKLASIQTSGKVD